MMDYTIWQKAKRLICKLTGHWHIGEGWVYEGQSHKICLVCDEVISKKVGR